MDKIEELLSMNTASKMRKKADEMRELAEQEQLKQYDQIIEKIQDAAERGEYSISCDKVNSPTRKKLEEEGFEIKVHDGMRMQSWTSIKW